MEIWHPSPAAFEAVQNLAYNLLDESGKLRLYPASWYDSIPYEILRLFCHFYCRYFFPTVEAIEFLSKKIKDKNVIEIGAGCGDLGYHLGIPMTDNYQQTFSDVKAAYAKMGQPVINYGEDVIKMDALTAIEEFKPDYVIGAWITPWGDPKLPAPPEGCNIDGVKEEELLRRTGYINIAAKSIHSHKSILRHPHRTIAPEFLRSRKQNRYDNVIWIWENMYEKS